MDLLDDGQVSEIRQALYNIADTFAFPIKIIRTTYVDAAFAAPPAQEVLEVHAIRDYSSSAGERNRYRNSISVQDTHEFDVYVGWHEVELVGLADNNYKILLDNNDVVEMEGQIWEIMAFAGVGDMTKHPTFLQLRLRRRFQSPDGADAV